MLATPGYSPALDDSFAQPDAPPPTLQEVDAPRGWYPLCKRVVEFAVALVLLALALPLIAVAMTLVKLTSRGPVLYSQTRLGRHGKPFTVYKIRSMTYGAENLTGACWSKPGDSRITPVGRWLRRTHVDELPQLWNVLKGDMSLIGPRPERPEFVPQLEQAIPLYGKRLLVRPGVTGLAQVQLPPDTNLDSVRRKIAYDIYYIRHCSWWMDARIYWATLCHMLGVPFRWIRSLFRFPGRESIEHFYARHALAIPVKNALSVGGHAVNGSGHGKVALPLPAGSHSS